MFHNISDLMIISEYYLYLNIEINQKPLLLHRFFFIQNIKKLNNKICSYLLPNSNSIQNNIHILLEARQ